jgi:predicted glutamine amidotransferase
MCIAIFNKSTLLSFDTIRNSFDNNNDGAGLLYIDGGRLQVVKETASAKAFYKKYKAIREKNTLPILLHFRIGTHGHFADYNLHPFLVNSQIGFVHNGVIRIAEIDARYSDTNHFNRLVLQTMKRPARIFKDGTNEAALVSHFCSTNSKLIFLNAAGEFRIFNEAAGHWDKFGNWYSNNTYKPSAYRDFGGKKVAKASAGACDFSGGRGWSDYGRGGNYYGDWLGGKSASQPATPAPAKPAGATATGVKYPAVSKPATAPADKAVIAARGAYFEADAKASAEKSAAAGQPAKDYAASYRAQCLALLGYGENDLGADAALADAMAEYEVYNIGALYAALLYR